MTHTGAQALIARWGLYLPPEERVHIW